MLATCTRGAPDKKSIVFTIRHGVKWNDGKPFSADDVVFTFNLMKQVPVDRPLRAVDGRRTQSVTPAGNKVTMTFSQPAETYFFNFADQVAHRAQAHLSHRRSRPRTPTHGRTRIRLAPGRSRSTRAARTTSSTRPTRPTGRTASPTSRRSSTRHTSTTARRTSTWPPARRSGEANTSQTSSSSTCRSRRDNHTWSPAGDQRRALPEPRSLARRPASWPSGRRSPTRHRPQSDLGHRRGWSATAGEPDRHRRRRPSTKYYDATAVTAAGYDKPDLAKAKHAAGRARVLAVAPAEPVDHHHHRLHRLGRLARRDQAAARADRHQPDRQDLAQQTFDTKLFTGDFDLAYYGEHRRPDAVLRAARRSCTRRTPRRSASPPTATTSATRTRRWTRCSTSTPTADDADAGRDDQADRAVDAQGRPGHPDDRVGRLVPVQHQGHRRLADRRRTPTPSRRPSTFPDVEQVLLHLYSKSAQ